MADGAKYSHWKIFRKYLSYYLTAGNAHSVHSPFVFKLYREIITRDLKRNSYAAIEHAREKLGEIGELHNCSYSLSANSFVRKRSIASIARNSAVRPRYGRLLSRLVAYFNPKEILEIGTSLGISTLYLARNFKGSQILSLEGCRDCAAVATQHLSHALPGVVDVIHGEFSETLPVVLQKTHRLGFAFIDGNHRKDAVLSYVEMMKPYMHNGSIIVVDDIHWSLEMEEAWAIITKDQHVTVTLDLFFFGLLIFREGQVKENFSLRF
jgi:predicted O-methyltransferase YrrM